MSEIDNTVKTILDVSVSVMLRKTALRKLKKLKHSVLLKGKLMQRSAE